ncbi:MAG: hypothetical protein V1735_04030 [Nanoarchaeota archaeon]
MALGTRPELWIVLLLLAAGPASAAYYIYGNVANAPDGMLAGWRNVTAVYFNDTSKNTTCAINPEENAYGCNIEDISGYTFALSHTWVTFVDDIGDGYLAGPVSGLTQPSHTIMPGMTLHFAVEVATPTNTTYAVDHVFLNATSYAPYNATLWYRFNGSNVTLCSLCTGGTANITGIEDGYHNLTVFVNRSLGATRLVDLRFLIDADCGDGTCQDDESCSSCAADCGECDAGDGGDTGGRSGGGSGSGGIIVDEGTVYKTNKPVEGPVVVQSDGFVKQALLWMATDSAEVRVVEQATLSDELLSEMKVVDVVTITPVKGEITKALLLFRISKAWLQEEQKTLDEVLIGRVEGGKLKLIFPEMVDQDDNYYYTQSQQALGTFVLGVAYEQPGQEQQQVAPPPKKEQSQPQNVSRIGVEERPPQGFLQRYLLIILLVLGLVVGAGIVVKKRRDKAPSGRFRKKEDDES